MSRQPWPIRAGRLIGRLIAAWYPRSIEARSADVEAFVDEAVERAWQTRGFRGVLVVAARLLRDVIAARARGLALPITASGSSQPPDTGNSKPRVLVLGELASDLRYAFRRLAHAPGFTAVALLTLALGVGSTTAMFTVADDVLLKPLPYGRPDRLVAIQENVPKFASISPELEVAAYDFVRWRERSKAFDELALVATAGGVLSTGGDPISVAGGLVSGNFFGALGLRAEVGRLLVADDERPGHDDVVVISHALWVNRFSADPGIVGRRIVIAGRSYGVVGVLPAGVEVPRQSELQSPVFDDSAASDFWRPLVITPSDEFLMTEFDYGCLGRMKPGVTVAQARADLGIIEGDIARSAGEHEALHAIVRPLQAQAGSRARDGLIVLLGAVAAVLLIVCVNLSNLLLSRSVGRRREFAVRAALGASAGRLARQLLTETLLVAVAGSSLGFATATWAVHAVLLTAPLGLPHLNRIGIDAPAWIFASFVTLATTVVVGALPARRLSREAARPALADGARSVGDGISGGRVSRLLVSAEVALSAASLVVAGLLLSSFVRLMRVDTGIVADRVIITSAGVNAPAEGQIAFDRRVLEAVRALPGVTALGLTNKLPLSGEGGNNGLHAADGAMGPDDWPTVDYRSVSPGYFDAIGIPLLRGRLIQDTDGAHPVAVISATTAARIWPGIDPIGHAFQLGGSESPVIEVVGVVGDVHGASLQKAPSPTVYLPCWQRLRSPSVFAVRTAGDPAAVEGELRLVLHHLQPEAPLARVRAMDAIVDASVAERRFQLEVVLFFATIGVLLAGIGVYGVVAQSVARRTREIGLRMALGATRADVWRLVARQGLGPVAVGLAAGLAGAVGAGQVVRGLLFGVKIGRA